MPSGANVTWSADCPGRNGARALGGLEDRGFLDQRGHVGRVGAQDLFHGRDGCFDGRRQGIECDDVAFRFRETAGHADSVVLLAGYRDANELRKETGTDGLGRVELARFHL